MLGRRSSLTLRQRSRNFRRELRDRKRTEAREDSLFPLIRTSRGFGSCRGSPTSLHFHPTPRWRFLRRKCLVRWTTRELIARFIMRRQVSILRTPSPCLDLVFFPFALRAAGRRRCVRRRIFVTICCCTIDRSLSGRNFFRATLRLTASI